MLKHKSVRFILGFIMVVLMFNVVRTIYATYQSSKQVEVLAGEVAALREEKQVLEDEKAYRESDYYIEQQARDALNLKKPGDVVFVVEEAEADESASEAQTTDLSPPEQWRDLLLGGIF